MSMDGPINPPEPRNRCVVHALRHCTVCWPYPDIEDDRREHEAKREGWEEGHLWRNSHRIAFAPRTLTADDRPDYKWDQEEVDDLRRQGYERGLADARAAVDAVGRWRSFPDDTLLSRAAVLAAIDALIHDGEATPLDNMGLRDRDEVENRLSSIRSLMLARPPRTTADALRALADDIQGAAIDGEA
jgi:hypothetical protein